MKPDIKVVNGHFCTIFPPYYPIPSDGITIFPRSYHVPVDSGRVLRTMSLAEYEERIG